MSDVEPVNTSPDERQPASDDLNDLLAEIVAVCASDADEPAAPADSSGCDIDELTAAVERLTGTVDAISEAADEADNSELEAAHAFVRAAEIEAAAPAAPPDPPEAVTAAEPAEPDAAEPLATRSAPDAAPAPADEAPASPEPATAAPADAGPVSDDALLAAVACFDDPETAVAMETGEGVESADAAAAPVAEPGPEAAPTVEPASAGEPAAAFDPGETPASPPDESASEFGDLAIHELDDELADDVETLLNANFETVSDVLDDVFEEHAALGDASVTVPPMEAFLDEPAAEAVDSPDDPAGGPGEEPPAHESEMIPERPATPEPVDHEPPAEPVAPSEDPAAPEPEPEIDPEPREAPATPRPTVHQEPELLVARLSSLTFRCLKAVLREASYPLRLLPSGVRPVVDWIALSLVFWVPIVWVVAFLIVGR